MNLQKTIELLTRWQEGGDITSFDDVNRAVKLGIEALKHTIEMREHPIKYHARLLPGETKE